MLGYVARRLALAVGTVLVAVLISFLLVHATDGSPGAIVLGPGATPAEVAAKNAELGWDRPLVTQFFDYLGHLVRGDLGTSIIDSRDIGKDLATRLPVTGRRVARSWPMSRLSMIEVPRSPRTRCPR